MSRHAEIAATLRKYILQQFPAARYKEFADDGSLLDSGIVDSMGILEIVVFIEKTFGIIMSDEDLTPRNFQSINSLSEYLASKIPHEV